MAFLAALLCPGAIAARMPGDLADQVIDGIHEERRRAGLPELQRRAALDAAAERRARRIADLPEEERLSSGVPVDADLRAAGVLSYHHARTHLDLQKGGRKPAEGVLERWRGYASGWEDVMAPALTAVGAAAVQAPDGWIVFVAVLVEDQELASDPAEVEALLREAVEGVRSEHGLPPLEPDRALAAVARAHSEEMVRRGFFDHVSPDGENLDGRLRNAEIHFRSAAENIARTRGVKNPVETTVGEWMASPGHRANILDGKFTRTGVGVAVDADGTVYVTQVFLRPAGSP
jgi:uncharacterized protein YkwD